MRQFGHSAVAALVSTNGANYRSPRFRGSAFARGSGSAPSLTETVGCDGFRRLAVVVEANGGVLMSETVACDGFRQLAFTCRVAAASTVALVGSVTLLAMLSIPLEQSESIAIGWYTTVYWIFSGIIAVLAGLFVAIVLLLLAAVYGIIQVLAPDEE
ncbi:MAG: hypothetical protein R3320_05370 [Nitriliruptorales bacterium]|nr:hypothetical protein [Nitriliruptorales bacterium]